MGIFNFLKRNKSIENDNGPNEIYYQNGKGNLHKKFHKKDGKFNGKYYEYREDGKLEREKEYLNGVLHGRGIEINVFGSVVNEYIFENGVIVFLTHYHQTYGEFNNGEIIENKPRYCKNNIDYTHDNKKRIRTYFFNDGVTKSEILTWSESESKYMSSLPEKFEVIHYFPNGEIKCEGCVKYASLIKASIPIMVGDWKFYEKNKFKFILNYDATRPRGRTRENFKIKNPQYIEPKIK